MRVIIIQISLHLSNGLIFEDECYLWERTVWEVLYIKWQDTIVNGKEA